MSVWKNYQGTESITMSVKRRNISDWSKLRYANTRVQQYASWDSTLSLMLLVNSHKLKMARRRYQAENIIEESQLLKAFALDDHQRMNQVLFSKIFYCGCQDHVMTVDSPTTPKMSPLLPEQNDRTMFTWVLCPVRVVSCHRISLKIKKR